MKRVITVDKHRVRESIFETVFLRYGAGAEFVRRLTATKIWNIVAWVLIVIGALAWAVFLRWDPQG